MRGVAVAQTTVKQARQGLAIYLAIVVVASGILDWIIIQSGESTSGQGAVALLMWVPGLASIVARLVQREGFHDISLRLGGRQGLRQAAIGWLFPLGVGVLAYGVAWSAGLVSFTLPATDYFPSATSPVVKFALSLVLGLTILTVGGMLTAAGEELGWRGYMLTRLIDAGLPHPVLLSGLIWAAWHMPLVLSGLYVGMQGPLSIVMFVVSVVSISYVWARLRLNSGSIWPVIVAHGAWNAIIRGTFDSFAGGSVASPWVGESGVLVALVTLVLALALTRGTWQLKRAPADAPYARMQTAQL
ncbi:MAG: CPBP family intramembrane glutamic endopeptidase [Chloroflexota bacterium]